jgi:hypothetical protein
VANLLGRREGFDKEQIEESWKVIKTSITESAEKVIQLTKEIKQRNGLMIIARKQSGNVIKSESKQ